MLKGIKDFFNLDRTEVIGLSVLIIVILLVGGLNFLVPTLHKDSKTDFSKAKELAKLIEKTNKERKNNAGYKKNRVNIEGKRTYFYFDPNNADADTWSKLGMPQYRIKRILKYIEKGGRFHKADDLLKFCENDELLFNNIKPYIKFPEIVNVKKDTEFRDVLLDINVATSADFCKLKGIGFVLSERIVAFRDKLGGFYSVEQISEVYGIDSLTFTRIKENMYVEEGINVEKISLNLASFKTFAAHPYIGYDRAKKILNLRTKKGVFKDLSELISDHVFDEHEYAKAIHYLILWGEG